MKRHADPEVVSLLRSCVRLTQKIDDAKAERHAAWRRLRELGVTFDEIGARSDVTGTAVRLALQREKAAS